MRTIDLKGVHTHFFSSIKAMKRINKADVSKVFLDPKTIILLFARVKATFSRRQSRKSSPVFMYAQS